VTKEAVEGLVQLLTMDEAAAYIGVGRSHFKAHVRQQLAAEYDVAAPGCKPAPRFHRSDLDAWMNTRRRARSA